MTNVGKHVKWHNSVQNHQNGEPRPVLGPQIEGYGPVELFQWEMCVQFLLCVALTKHPTSDVRDKIKSIIIKLQEMHGKDKFLLFTEKGKRIKIKMLPAKAAEVYGFFDCTVCEKGYKNVSLILHAMAPMSFYDFKTLVYQWLQLNIKCI
eukprot:2104161-Ditylum_brightwellii.AAC.1